MNSDVPYTGKYLRLCKQNNWEYVERINSKASVLILALIPWDKDPKQKAIILVEQFRIPLNKYVIELPAGICENDEYPIDAAVRELREETGYRASKMEFMFRSPSSSGLTNEMVEIFKADYLDKASEGGGIDDEKIKIHIQPLKMLCSWLYCKEHDDNCLVDSKIYAALGWNALLFN